MKQTHGIRLLVALLALLLALAVFGACDKTPAGGDETTGGGNTTTAGGETTAAPAETDSIRVGDYALIVPEAATETETDAANSLMAAVSEKLGATFKETKSDFVAGGGEKDAVPCLCPQHLGFNGGTPRQPYVLGGGDVKYGFIVANQDHDVGFNAIHAKPHRGSFLGRCSSAQNVYSIYYTTDRRFLQDGRERFRGRFGEILNSDGSFFVKPLRKKEETRRSPLKGYGI
jgi:hypothetical protein